MGDLSGQLISMKDEVVLMKEEFQKKDIMIAELKSIIMELKPNYVFPTHLLSIPSTDAVTTLLSGQSPHHIHQLQPADQAHMLRIFFLTFFSPITNPIIS
jgi:hypothetical protein